MLSDLLTRCSLTALFFLVSPANAGERYQIDPAHTFSSFEYKHWGWSLQRGRFDKNIGYLELDLAARAGVVNIEIDANSVSTGHDMFNHVMRSEDFFDAQQYPKIVFNSTKLLFDQDNLTQIEGLLTIKDRRKAVTIDVTRFGCHLMFLSRKRACGAHGTTKILRSDFKMGSYANFVSDEITLYFSVEGIKE